MRSTTGWQRTHKNQKSFWKGYLMLTMLTDHFCVNTLLLLWTNWPFVIPACAPCLFESQPIRHWRQGSLIKYSKLQATLMLPGTDKTVARLMDMNYELKWTSLHNLTCVWTERGPIPERLLPDQGPSVSCAHNSFLCMPVVTTWGSCLYDYMHWLYTVCLIWQFNNTSWCSTQILPWRFLLRNIVWFRGTRINVLSNTPMRKIRPSLRRFSRNPKTLNCITCRFVVPNFTQIKK